MVRLLKGSGTRPTLVVSSAPHADVTTPTTRGHRIANGDRGHASGYGSVKKHSREFKEKMEQVLLEDERQRVIQQLTRFSQNRYIDDNITGAYSKNNDILPLVINPQIFNWYT